MIYEILDKTIPGSFSYGNKGLEISSPEYSSPLIAKNLSAGIKAFALIKLMLEQSILKEKDVLILDEPEIHLHPEWLLSYAEIVVLLQKHFDLSLIITTHSSDFLQAIEYYSIKHKNNDVCKYYLSSTDNNSCVFEDVTNCIYKIYKELVAPSALIDDLMYNLETENE